jgi:hypothetical protein
MLTHCPALTLSSEVYVMSEPADVDVVLEGGPNDLPAEARKRRVPAGDQKVKVEHCGGYEHFERSGAGVYRWTARTKIAE